MKPSTKMRRAIRKAFTRRYGYAALRTLRLGVARALEMHWEHTIGEKPYEGTEEIVDVYDLYWSALKRLRKRWPTLDLEDVRAEP